MTNHAFHEEDHHRAGDGTFAGTVHHEANVTLAPRGDDNSYYLGNWGAKPAPAKKPTMGSRISDATESVTDKMMDVGEPTFDKIFDAAEPVADKMMGAVESVASAAGWVASKFHHKK